MTSRRNLTTWVVSAAMLLGVGFAGEGSAWGFERTFVDRTDKGYKAPSKPHYNKQAFRQNYRLAQRHFMPKNQEKYSESGLLVVSGKVIDEAMQRAGAVGLAANARNSIVVEGVLRAAERAKAALIFEIAKSESTYCGINFNNMAPEVHQIAKRNNIKNAVVAFHADHYGIKDPKADVEQARRDIPKMFKDGITSIAIDPSHLPADQNLLVTLELARLVPRWAGLETEVGEIKGKEGTSTVAEAVYQIEGMLSHGVRPDWIALNNGTTHGVQDKQAGIQVALTREIHAALAPYLISGAQHGTSGNDYGRMVEIRNQTNTTKANVATALQMISWGVEVNKFGNAVLQNGAFLKQEGRGVPAKLWKAMVTHAAKQGWEGGNYKKLNLPFEEKIRNLPTATKERMIKDVEAYAFNLLTNVFGAENTAVSAVDAVVAAGSHYIGVKRGRIVTPQWDRETIDKRAALIDANEGPAGDFDD